MLNAIMPNVAAPILSGNTKGGSITVQLTSCLTCLDSSVLQMKTKIVSCHTADFKPVKQEVNGTVILPLLVFPDFMNAIQLSRYEIINQSLTISLSVLIDEVRRLMTQVF
jgi:hypothetical protein